MKFLIPIFAVLILFTGCSGDKIKEATWPKDLESKKTFLREKKAEIKAINLEIEQLKNEIAELDTSAVAKSRKPVTVSIPGTADFSRQVEIQATVESDDLVGASSETGGRIISLNVKEGDYVSKGKLIASIDMETVKNQVGELEKSLELANEVYLRQSRLWEQQIGSEVQYLQAKNNKERIEKSIESVQHQLTKANVYAPLTGVVDMVMAKSGEMAAPGMPIVQILNTNRVKVVADVPESYLKAVKKGATVQVLFPALDKEMKARVTMLGRTINPANRTFRVECDVANSSGVLKPNLLATMFIQDYSEKDAVLLPTDLIQQDVSGKDYVYIKAQGEEGDIAKKVFISTGESADGKIIVTEGLTGEEEIIFDGARGLAEDELIEIIETQG